MQLFAVSGAAANQKGSAIATIDDLMSKVDSKYTLVHLSARRAREINAYYHQLGEGIHQFVRPLVENVDSNKPLSIALEEIAQEKIIPQYPGDARAEAEALLGADLAEEATGLEVVAGEDESA
jgi:DNA-directed RNA polymerase subunit omega